MKLRVFVFDDDRLVGSYLERILTGLGHEVHVFPRAHACLTCRCHESQTCADLIISDVEMPGLRGVEFIQNQIARGCQATHFALMSGAWKEAEKEIARSAGCTVFSKPIKVHELRYWLRQCEVNIDSGRTLAQWFIDDADSRSEDERA